MGSQAILWTSRRSASSREGSTLSATLTPSSTSTGLLTSRSLPWTPLREPSQQALCGAEIQSQPATGCREGQRRSAHSGISSSLLPRALEGTGLSIISKSVTTCRCLTCLQASTSCLGVGTPRNLHRCGTLVHAFEL